MSLQRFVLVLLFAALPLAALRGLWWSDLLFGKPWDAAGEGVFTTLNMANLMQGALGGIVTFVALTFVAVGLDMLIGAARRATLPLSLLIGLAIAALIPHLMPGLKWAAFWPLAGYILVALVWIYGLLQFRRL